MRKFLLAAAATAATAASFAIAPAAEARQGCGVGFHRGYYGRCVPNRGYRGNAVVAGPGVRLVIGNYYHGRGYWDGRRYWQNRYRYHNGWRYR